MTDTITIPKDLFERLVKANAYLVGVHNDGYIAMSVETVATYRRTLDEAIAIRDGKGEQPTPEKAKVAR